MIEPLQAVLIRMLLNEIKKYVYSNFFSKNFFSFLFLPKTVCCKYFWCHLFHHLALSSVTVVAVFQSLYRVTVFWGSL